MGYANPAQLSAGIHTRQYSRAFIINDGSQSVVFISVDCALMDQVIKTEVRI
jgi:neutral ceramidase